MNPSLRLACPLLSYRVRVTRCTELILERYGLFPEQHIPEIMRRTGYPRSRIDGICAACPYHPSLPGEGPEDEPLEGVKEAA